MAFIRNFSRTLSGLLIGSIGGWYVASNQAIPLESTPTNTTINLFWYIASNPATPLESKPMNTTVAPFNATRIEKPTQYNPTPEMISKGALKNISWTEIFQFILPILIQVLLPYLFNWLSTNRRQEPIHTTPRVTQELEAVLEDLKRLSISLKCSQNVGSRENEKIENSPELPQFELSPLMFQQTAPVSAKPVRLSADPLVISAKRLSIMKAQAARRAEMVASQHIAPLSAKPVRFEFSPVMTTQDTKPTETVISQHIAPMSVKPVQLEVSTIMNQDTKPAGTLLKPMQLEFSTIMAQDTKPTKALRSRRAAPAKLTELVNQDTKPVNQDTKPENQDTKPENQDTKPENQDTKPVNQDTKPVNQDSKPLDQDIKPIFEPSLLLSSSLETLNKKPAQTENSMSFSFTRTEDSKSTAAKPPVFTFSSSSSTAADILGGQPAKLGEENQSIVPGGKIGDSLEQIQGGQPAELGGENQSTLLGGENDDSLEQIQGGEPAELGAENQSTLSGAEDADKQSSEGDQSVTPS